MTSNHSYDTYTYWSFVPLFVGSCIIILVWFVLITVPAICKYNQCRNSQYFVGPLLFFVKVTFGDHIKKEEGTWKYTFYHYEISLVQIIILSSVTLLILWATFMSFWISFIANETFVCGPQLDCFLRDPSTHYVLSSEPLDNCTSYDSTNGAMVFFEFIFDLSKGFSSAVGFMGVAVVYCRLYIHVSMMIQLWSKKYQMAHYIMHIVIAFIFILTFFVVLAVPFFSDVVFKTTKSITIFMAYLD